MTRYLPKRHGDKAEDLALQYLLKQGLILVTRNYRCRWGEIDLIMRDTEGLVFVEVRYRKHAHFGSAADSVATLKQARLGRCAHHYLCKVENNLHSICRIDVIALDSRHLKIDWIRNAVEMGA